MTRADLTCSFFSGSSSSAHCLRFDENAWYWEGERRRNGGERRGEGGRGRQRGENNKITYIRYDIYQIASSQDMYTIDIYIDKGDQTNVLPFPPSIPPLPYFSFSLLC
jgi:hypothetical protein